MNSHTLLQIQDLSIGFFSESGIVPVTDSVSLEISEGEAFGLAGESGCGKTITALAILRLLPKPGSIILSGKILFKGVDILSLSIDKLRDIRGREISMIFQEPSAALNPLYPLKNQLLELFDYHSVKDDPVKRVRDILNRVGFSDPDRVLNSYPHELSGGMLQRAMIAMAVMLKPSLIIADEPTTALDVTVQAQIMELLIEMQRETGTSVLLITHNLSLIAHYTSKIAIMYAGRIAETGESGAFLDNPLHPYSQGLLRALPDLRLNSSRLEPIPGQVPQPKDYVSGCRFFDRCSKAFFACKNKPPLFSVQNRHVACFLYDNLSVAPSPEAPEDGENRL